jgi:tetratricopeptide (TPR) repeat protein
MRLSFQPGAHSRLKQFTRAAVAVLGLLSTTSVLSAQSLSAANADLQAGRADDAVAKLNEALKADPNSAEANNLLCRVEFTLQQFDSAASHCEKAATRDPQNSNYHMWLARTYGERASRANFMSAFSMAKKSREEFESAVKLDPRNAEAMADLGEFYKEAPGVVGGGMDKAEAIAKQLEAVDTLRGHVLRGQMAEKSKDFDAAEREYKAAAAGPHASFGWISLAGFYRRHERWAEMESAVNSGATAAAKEKHASVALFNGATVLQRANRNLPLAAKLFESYLAASDKTEEAPAFDVLVRLAKVRQQMGDSAGAQRERTAALALAHTYKPAQELKS